MTPREEEAPRPIDAPDDLDVARVSERDAFRDVPLSDDPQEPSARSPHTPADTETAEPGAAVDPDVTTPDVTTRGAPANELVDNGEHPDLDAQARVRLSAQDVSTLALDASETPSPEDDVSVSAAREAVQGAQAGSASPRMGAAMRAMRVQNLTRAARSVVQENIAALPSADVENGRHLDRSDYPTPAQRDEAPTLGRW